jgi:TolA-binding protein
MRFFHAELRYALADFEGAGEEYEYVVLRDVRALEAKPRPGEPPPKAGKFFKDALENAVFAWDLVAKKLDDEKKNPAAADPKKRIPVVPQRQRLLDACLRYLKWQPKGEKNVEIAYKAARLYYQHNAFAEATDLFTRIALDHPGHELAGYSTNLVLDAYNLLGDWRNVNGWAKRFYGNAKLLEAHPALKADLAKIIEESAFKVIEERERARDWEGAAEEYLTFARDWPQSRLAATALFNASVDYVKARRIDKAVEVRNLVLQRFPDHELAPAALYDNAEAYEAIAEFERAAELYERYFASWRAAQRAKGAPPRAKVAKGKGKKGKVEAKAEEAPRPGAYDEKKATDGIINAAVFRAGLRQWAKAEAASRAYLDTWPSGADAPRIFLSLADLYAKQGQTSKQLKQLEEYQRKYAKDPDEWLGLQNQLAQLFERSGNAPLARRAQAQGLEYWRRNKDKVKERGLALVARAMYDEIEPAFAEYDRISLNVAPRFLKGQLEVKAKKLKKLEEAYGQVVHLKQAEPAVCALYKIGFAYKRFAQALYDAPIPKEIRKDKAFVEEYKSLLSQQAEPLEAKAIDGLALAANAAREYGVQNECARQATAILLKHKPEEYGPSPEVLPPIVGPQPVDAPRGYGLLAEVEGVPVRAAGTRRVDPGLPPLKVRTVAGANDRGPADEPSDADPQKRVIKEEPVPLKKKAPKKKGGAAEDDEDLLP